MQFTELMSDAMDLIPMADEKLVTVLERTLERSNIDSTRRGASLSGIFWSWEAFGIHPRQAAEWFPGADLPQVLKELNDFRMRELCLLEVLGLRYHARLISNARNFEETQMYAGFMADELRHASLIRPFAPVEMRGAYLRQPLVHACWKITETGHPIALRLIIQVLGEGMVLQHYTRISKDCAQPELAEILSRIVQDEAAHHGTGVRLQRNHGNEVATPADAFVQTVQASLEILDTVRGWPHVFLRAWELSAGERTEEELRGLIRNLQPQIRAELGLNALRSLIEAHFPTDVVAELKRRNAFQAENDDWILQHYLTSPVRPVGVTV